MWVSSASSPQLSLAGIKCTSSIHVFNQVPKDLFVESSPDPEDLNSFVVRLIASTRMVDEAGGDRLLKQLNQVLKELVTAPEGTLTSILGV
jgi:hypothetical protein